MVEIKPAGLYFTIFGIFCAALVSFLNFRLIIKLFRSNAYKNKHEYQLFAYRFCVDCSATFAVTIYFIGMVIFFTNSLVLQYHPLFFVALLCSNINAARGLLALCIAIERTFAAYSPINFHNYRAKFPSPIVIIICLAFGGFEDVMLYHFCQFSYVERETCSAFGCALNACFLRYWGINKSIIAALTAFLSMLIFLKLLCLKCQSRHKNNDLTRANQLCLADTVTVLIFDFSPYIFTLILGDQVIYLEGYGPYNAVIKVIACFFDVVIATLVIGKVLRSERANQGRKPSSTRTEIVRHTS